jgi:hypothetical protein
MFGRIVVASVVAEIASSPNARGYADLDWTALGLIAAKIRRSHAMKKMNAKSLANLVRWPGDSGFIRQRRVGNKLPYDLQALPSAYLVFQRDIRPRLRPPKLGSVCCRVFRSSPSSTMTIPSEVQ